MTVLAGLRVPAAAAAVAVAAVAGPFASPAAASDPFSCVVVEVDGRSVEVCEDFVEPGSCPYGSSGVVVEVMGRPVRVCFTPQAA